LSFIAFGTIYPVSTHETSDDLMNKWEINSLIYIEPATKGAQNAHKAICELYCEDFMFCCG